MYFLSFIYKKMTKIKTKAIEYLVVLLIIFSILVGVGVVLFFWNFERPNFQLGVNFSKSYSEYLGLNWQKTYLAILDELKVKNVRLSAPWNEIESQKDAWDFSALDWQVKEAEKRGVNVVLTLGRRTPHWPECHDPEWIKKLPPTYVVDRQLKMMKKVIEHYKNFSNIKIWQIENEPMLNVFGICPPADFDLLRKEIALEKTLDSRPAMVTDSGELSFWVAAGNVGDLFGTTLYKVTYNKWLGYFFYHLPASFYRAKAWLIGLPANNVYVSELQAEPWSTGGLLNMSPEEQKVSMDAKRLINHVDFARRTGFAGAYLWGAEWWLWLKEEGDDSVWQAAKGLFK